MLNQCVTTARLPSTLSHPAPPLHQHRSTHRPSGLASRLAPRAGAASPEPLGSRRCLRGLSSHTGCLPDLLLLLSKRYSKPSPLCQTHQRSPVSRWEDCSDRVALYSEFLPLFFPFQSSISPAQVSLDTSSEWIMSCTLLPAEGYTNLPLTASAS